MTINIDSIWVIFGIATIIGFGGYVGVYWAVHLILASKKNWGLGSRQNYLALVRQY